MDTFEAPQITLKKVGKDRDKKKGGAPLFGGGSRAGQAFKGALGGSGSGASSALGGLAARVGSKLAIKIALSMLVSSVFGGAWIAGRSMRPAARKSPRAFSDAGAQKSRDNQKYDVDPSNVAKAASYQSGLSMVSGSLGGKSPEELAAERAAAEKAAADAAAKEQSATPDAAGAGAVPDPAALAAAAAGAGAVDPAAAGKGGNGPFGQRFGSLSSSLGGAGGGSKLSGGAGLSGGMSGKFDTAKLGNGLRGFGGSQAAPRSTGKAPVRSNGGPRGLAARQLNRAFTAGVASRSQGNTGAAYTAGQPFDNGMNTDKLIADPTSAAKPAGTTGGTSGSSGSTGGGGGSQPNGVGNVDPYGEPDDCTQILPATFGENVKDVKYENSPGGGCVIAGGGATDEAPWKNMVSIAKVLVIIGAILLTISGILGLLANSTDAFFGLGEIARGIAIALAGVAAAIGAIVALMGAMIMAQGNSTGGGIFLGTGAALGVAGYIAASTGDVSSGSVFTTWVGGAIIGGVGLIAGLIGGLADTDGPDPE